MSDIGAKPWPTDLRLRKDRRMLTVAFGFTADTDTMLTGKPACLSTIREGNFTPPKSL